MTTLITNHTRRTTMITTEENSELATRWLQWISAGDVAALLATSTPDWEMHGGPPNLPSGPAGVCVLAAHLADVRQTWTVDDVIAAGDRVVVRATNVCEQPSFFGVPGAGIEQVFTATFTFAVRDGRVQTIWRNADDLGRLLQLGARISAPVPVP
jgi:ketosteroid isomerase-like protein